ncbi:FecR family protein [Chitinophaga vietnamensis]|uniref:FecR family protein n=1 Tax=Chitinophaga vietnamensis TaxID=2593957 RepID=UPI001177E11F|nr:FecR domain-containing protein [Chitinophaga vietnamensis]
MKYISSQLNIAGLIVRQLTGEITSEEWRQLQAWRRRQPENEQLYQQLITPSYLEERLSHSSSAGRSAAYEQLIARIRQEPELDTPALRYSWRRWRYAAALLPILAIAAWWLHRGHPATKPATITQEAKQLATANTVQLIIGHDDPISLNKQGQQTINSHGVVAHSSNGYLSYPIVTGAGSVPPEQLLITPRGMDYKLMLPDGSKVWLGAASKLRFPSAFTSNERRVTLDGEAYFEVTADAHHPFIVNTARGCTRALGTAFNIKAYSGERYEQATLVTGAVTVVAPADKITLSLKPGEQALLAGDGATRVQPADMKVVLAWQKGLFYFQSASLENVMEELSRWYNVQVVYEAGTNRSLHFTGRIARSPQISEVLQFLEATGKIHCSLRGQQLKISSANH